MNRPVTEETAERFLRIMNTVRAASTIDAPTTEHAEFPYSEPILEELPDSFDQPVTREPESTNNQPFKLDAVRINTSRFSGAVWYNKIQEQTIIVGGQGGISSWFTFLAARMFPRSIYTYDPDRVELVNLAGQLFSMNDIGRYKGEAVALTIEEFSDYRSVFSVNGYYTADSNTSRVMVCGFDNMAARRVFFNNWRALVESLPEGERKTCLFIDGRLAAESLQILCITGDAPWDIEKYEAEYLFEDAEADETVCSFKQTAFMANIIAGLMINMLVNFCANLCDGCRTLPFYTQYECDQFYLRLEGGV